jgi:tRNA nucleotidyltransferase (CCA-adding enzyme)
MKRFKHKYDFAIPLTFKEKIYGVLVVSTLKTLSDDEIEIFSSLGEDLSYAIYSKEVEAHRVEAIQQLKSNLGHFEYLSDRLRNPISVILGYLEMRDELGNEQVLKVVEEQTKKMMDILEELRKEEIKTSDIIRMF